MANQVADDGRCVFVAGIPKYAEWQELQDYMRTGGLLVGSENSMHESQAAVLYPHLCQDSR